VKREERRVKNSLEWENEETSEKTKKLWKNEEYPIA
jgi:hypothetical protein